MPPLAVGDESWERLRAVLLDAQAIGAIGAAPVEEHIAHAAAFAVALGPALDGVTRVVDLGSGAGLPGLVLALLAPAAELFLLEGRQVRAEQLEASVRRLALTDRVSVLAVRAEAAGRDARWRASFDVAVARGFAAPGVTAECAAPLLRVGGLLCVSEPPEGDPRSRWPSTGCAEFGLRLLGAPAGPYSMALLEQGAPCPDRFPRRVGIPAKRPRF